MSHRSKYCRMFSFHPECPYSSIHQSCPGSAAETKSRTKSWTTSQGDSCHAESLFEAHLLRPSSFCKLKISIDLAFSSSWDPAKRDDQTLLVTCFFFIQLFFRFPCASSVVWLFTISYLITFMQICWQQDRRSLLSEALNLSVHGCHGTNHLSPEQKDKTR